MDRSRVVPTFEAAVRACEPEALVRDALARIPEPLAGRPRLGLAMGKAALGMARGAGPVTRGVVVTSADDGQGVPHGWTVMVGSHPEPDERSLAAGDAVIDLVATAAEDDVLLALISGGASALVERPVEGVTLERLRAEIGAVMRSGAPIHAINARRRELSAIKGGKLAQLCPVPIVTLAISDVFDDDLAVIGSGPTIPPRLQDHAEVIAPMKLFAHQFAKLLHHSNLVGPLKKDTAAVADELVQRYFKLKRADMMIAWGEPVVRVPADHGVGGRAQQLALELARRLSRSTPNRHAFVLASDGVDGPAPPGRPAPAGAWVDGFTWDAIVRAGHDPEAALARCDAGTALDAVHSLIVTGPTGINHGDLVCIY